MENKSNPKISIIVPVYNVEAYLHQCIESLIGQTYKNIEIILVNDGSTDSSGEICDSFAKQDQRIIVIHKKNEGVGLARNIGISNASGDYVSFVDADDWVVPCLYENCITSTPPRQFDIIQYGYYKINKDNVRTGQNAPPSIVIDNLQLNRGLLVQILKSGAGLAVWDKIINRNLIVENNVWFDNKKRGQDFTFVITLFGYAKSLASIAKPLYNYRVLYGSKNKFDHDIIKNHMENFERIHALFGESEQQTKVTKKYLKNLAILWFLMVIPLNISNTLLLTKKEKITQIKLLYSSKIISGWLSTRGIPSVGPMGKLLVFIYSLKFPILLIFTARFLSFLRRNLNLTR
ncbi:MAG TPA: glycosyltransferase [Bacteroidales bacterium]|nr:glycosyltransferase [Bacteroidales bacterium]